MNRALFFATSFALVLLVSCDDGSRSSSADATVLPDGRQVGPDVDVTPAPVDAGAYTYTLATSTAALPLWTTPTARKVRPGDLPPEETRTGLSLSAARHEFEPVQLLIGPAPSPTSFTASLTPFPDLGSTRTSLRLARYTDSGWPEALSGVGPSTPIDVATDRATSLWIEVYVPPGAPAGEHTTILTLNSAGASISVPVTLTVFDFELPPEIGFKTQLNVSVQSLIPPDGSAIDAMTALHEHRFTPKSPTWPSGFNPSITWENSRSSNPCGVLWDEPDEGDEFSVGFLARRYLLGEGWNGVGWPNAMLFQFVDNSTPRPDSFCNIDRGSSHEGSAAYNAEWQEFLSALEGYLTAQGMIDKAYFYTQNEPQNDADHALAAHLCRLYKAAAPNLRLAISEEPKAEIAEDPGGACGYDIWIAHIRAFEETYAQTRQRLGEEVWLYSLPQDPDPFYNPTTPERQGMHARIIPWVGWRYRAPGWAYFDWGSFYEGHQPGVRAVLLREGIEDFEYLKLAAGGVIPGVDDTAAVDATARSVASSLTSWTQDPDAFMALRHELGRYLEGSREALPVLSASSDARPRETYAINFQDPAGQPSEDPLEVNGQTWIKVGWSPWDDALGYGFSGEHVDNPSIALYGYDDAGPDPVHNSYLFNDYGRDFLFEFALENGAYDVTIAVGRPGRASNDPHHARVEGVSVVDDEPTTDAEPQLIRTTRVELNDGRLSFEFGGRSVSTDDWAYTFVSHIIIEPAE